MSAASFASMPGVERVEQEMRMERHPQDLELRLGEPCLELRRAPLRSLEPSRYESAVGIRGSGLVI
jgi:hypothetical protein